MFKDISLLTNTKGIPVIENMLTVNVECWEGWRNVRIRIIIILGFTVNIMTYTRWRVTPTPSSETTVE